MHHKNRHFMAKNDQNRFKYQSNLICGFSPTKFASYFTLSTKYCDDTITTSFPLSRFTIEIWCLVAFWCPCVMPYISNSKTVFWTIWHLGMNFQRLKGNSSVKYCLNKLPNQNDRFLQKTAFKFRVCRNLSFWNRILNVKKWTQGLQVMVIHVHSQKENPPYFNN